MKKMRLKVKGVSSPKPSTLKIKREFVDRDGNFEITRRYLSPIAEDLPLLKVHYPGEYFQRIDGKSVVQRWKTEDGQDHHQLLFYPADGETRFKAMENDWTVRDDYYLLLWKRLNLFGIAKYSDVPSDVTEADFEKYLKTGTVKRFQLKTNGRLQLRINPRLKLKVKK